MVGRRTTTIAASAAFIGLALVAILIGALHARGTTDTAVFQAAPAHAAAPTHAAAPAHAAASSTPIAVPTPTAVAPGPKHTSPAQPHRTAAPVAFSQMVSARAGVVVGAVQVRLANATSHLPGETSGPSYIVTVRVTNAGATAVDLSDAVVNLYLGADQTPAIATVSASKPVVATLAAHRSATGRYVFRRPADAAAPLRVEVDLGATSTVVPFQGPAPAQS